MCGHCTAGARGVSSNSANSNAMQHQQSHLFEQGQRREKGGQQPVRPLHCRGEGCKQQLQQQFKQQQRDTAATVCAPLRAGADAGKGWGAARVAIRGKRAQKVTRRLRRGGARISI